MKPLIRNSLLIALLASPAAIPGEVYPDPPKVCEPCGPWNVPRAPFRVYGDTWYVGTDGLGAILIVAPEGHILIDGGLPQSAPLIANNIKKAGYRLEDIKFILNSHTHYDHAGGIAALQRASQATVAASPASKLALERGGPTEDDPQFAFGHEHNDYAPVQNVRVLADGEALRVGPTTVVAHFTPGHTPGGTTWTWQSCEIGRCVNIVYADSVNSVSAPGFRFTGDADHPSRVPLFERTIGIIEQLPCDILLAPHPDFIDMKAKLALWKQVPSVNPFIDASACKAYAAGGRTRLNARIAEERAAQ